LRTLAANLGALADRHKPGASLLAMLTERHDCDFFKQLKSGTIRPASSDISLAPCDDAECLSLRIGEHTLTLIAGRQIVSRERIEILALGTSAIIDDAQSATDVIRRIQDAGGIPVLSWAPGKWMFKREGIIRKLFQSLQPGDALAGDTTLRPIGWREPGIMREARQRGFGVIAGSDPLPFAGEEDYMGTYATACDAEIDPNAPLASLKAALVSGPDRVAVGHRCTVWPWLRRLRRNAKARSQPVG
jgi:hypothetical protein